MKIKNNCKHENPHTIARMRGSRVRMQCNDCGHLSKWIKGAELVKDERVPILTDQPGEVTKLTGPNSVHTAMQSERNDLEDLTVTELRLRAKDGGVKGYSKMRKDDLIVALVAGMPTR